MLLLLVQKSGQPVEVGRLSLYLQGFMTIPGGCLGVSEPSTVCYYSFIPLSLCMSSKKISCGLTLPHLSGSRLNKAVFKRVSHEDIQGIYNQRNDISMHKSRNDMNILCIIYIIYILYNHNYIVYSIQIQITYNVSTSHFTSLVSIGMVI